VKVLKDGEQCIFTLDSPDIVTLLQLNEFKLVHFLLIQPKVADVTTKGSYRNFIGSGSSGWDALGSSVLDCFNFFLPYTGLFLKSAVKLEKFHHKMTEPKLPRDRRTRCQEPPDPDSHSRRRTWSP